MTDNGGKHGGQVVLSLVSSHLVITRCWPDNNRPLYPRHQVGPSDPHHRLDW